MVPTLSERAGQARVLQNAMLTEMVFQSRPHRCSRFRSSSSLAWASTLSRGPRHITEEGRGHATGSNHITRTPECRFADEGPDQCGDPPGRLMRRAACQGQSWRRLHVLGSYRVGLAQEIADMAHALARRWIINRMSGSETRRVPV